MKRGIIIEDSLTEKEREKINIKKEKREKGDVKNERRIYIQERKVAINRTKRKKS